jgi:rRNA-processing protein FCF1
LPIYCGKAQFELNMNVIQDEQTLKILLEYKIDLFTDRTISNILNNFERLLRTAVARPDITLEELNGLLDQLEKQERITREEELTAVRAQKFRTARRRRFVRS